MQVKEDMIHAFKVGFDGSTLDDEQVARGLAAVLSRLPSAAYADVGVAGTNDDGSGASGTFTVRGLVWQTFKDGRVRSLGSILYYRLQKFDDGLWRNSAAGQNGSIGSHASLEGAKAAAMDDYSAQVSSAVAPARCSTTRHSTFNLTSGEAFPAVMSAVLRSSGFRHIPRVPRPPIPPSSKR